MITFLVKCVGLGLFVVAVLAVAGWRLMRGDRPEVAKMVAAFRLGQRVASARRWLPGRHRRGRGGESPQ